METQISLKNSPSPRLRVARSRSRAPSSAGQPSRETFQLPYKSSTPGRHPEPPVYTHNTRLFHAATDANNRQGRRAQAELIRYLAQYLPDRDRIIIEQIYLEGNSKARIARLTEHPPREIQRHIYRLLRRMRSPLFGYLVIHQQLLSTKVRRVAQLIVFEGQSQRTTAERLSMTLHEVRLHMHTLRIRAGDEY